MLIDRFEELDYNGGGWLDIGIDVPSAEQVAEMKEDPLVKKGKKNLIEAWEEKQKGFDLVSLRKKMDTSDKNSLKSAKGERKCH